MSRPREFVFRTLLFLILGSLLGGHSVVDSVDKVRSWFTPYRVSEIRVATQLSPDEERLLDRSGKVPVAFPGSRLNLSFTRDTTVGAKAESVSILYRVRHLGGLEVLQPIDRTAAPNIIFPERVNYVLDYPLPAKLPPGEYLIGFGISFKIGAEDRSNVVKSQRFEVLSPEVLSLLPGNPDHDPTVPSSFPVDERARFIPLVVRMRAPL